MYYHFLPFNVLSLYNFCEEYVTQLRASKVDLEDMKILVSDDVDFFDSKDVRYLDSEDVILF